MLLGQARRQMPIAVLTSPSVSGEVPAAMIRQWGMKPVRGSSTRSAGEALREMYGVLATDRHSLVITAAEPQFRQLRAVIDSLDQRRAQVLVESLMFRLLSVA